MPSEWLPAPALLMIRHHLSRRFTNENGTACLFLVLCLQILIRVIFLVVLNLDLRLPPEGSTVPALPQVEALGLQNSSLLGVASDPLGPPATISSHLPWTEFHALTLSDDTALGHSFSSISPSFMGNATHHMALPSQQGKFALSSLVSPAPQFSAHSMPEGIPAPASSLMASPHFSAPSFSSGPRRLCPSAPRPHGAFVSWP